MRTRVRPFLTLLLVLFCMVKIGHASSEYEWEGSSSSSWVLGANWDNNPGSQSDLQVYNVGAPSGYTNAPIISSNVGFTMDGVQVRNGGQLTISGGTNSINRDLFIYDGADVVMTGGTLNLRNIYMCDAGSTFEISAGTLNMTGSIYLGEDSPDNPITEANGTPTFTISGGTVSAVSMNFNNQEGDDPEFYLSSGSLTISQKITESGEAVKMYISGGTLDLNGDLEARDGLDEVDMTGGTINISGDWINDGTSSMTGGSIVFDGSAAQRIDAANGQNFRYLEIANTSATGVEFRDDITILDTLELTDGPLFTSNSSEVIVGLGDKILGGNSASYVDGPLRKVGNEAFTFPLGDDGDYKPLSMSAPSSVISEFTARYNKVNPSLVFGFGFGLLDGILELVSTEEYWELDRNVGVSSVQLTIGWDSQSGGVGDTSDLRVARWNGGNWENAGNSGTTGDTANGTITSAPISTFSPFTLASISSSNPLPIELLYFTAERDQNGVVDLNWATSSERNNSHFEVQKSRDLKSWTNLGEIYSKAIHGNSIQQLDYEEQDVLLESGTYYYRLKQIDFDGTSDYSRIVTIDFKNEDLKPTDLLTLEKIQMLIYPNPTQGQFIYARLSNDLHVSFEVRDLTGRLVRTESRLEAEHAFRIEMLDPLPAGNYILSALSAEGQLLSSKTFIQK